MNEVQLMGRLTKDVDLRYLQSGKAMGVFTLAVQRPFKNQNGEYDADFIRCKVFGKVAETIAEYVRKGHRMIAVGNIQTSKFQDNSGKDIFMTEVIVQRFEFVDSINSGQKGSSASSNSNRNSGSYQQDSFNSPDRFEKSGSPIDISDDDLPF